MQTSLNEGYKFKWLDVFEPSEQELSNLATTLHLPESALIDCLQPEHLPKFEDFEKFNFIILRFFDNASKLKDDTIQNISRKVAIFYNEQTLITIHRSHADWIKQTALKYSNYKHELKPYDLVCKLIKNGLQTYEDNLLHLDKEIDFFESKIFLKKKIPDILKNLYRIKRRIFILKRLFLLTKSVIESIKQSHKSSPFLQDTRDYYIKIETISEEIHDSILSLLNIYISLSSQKTNEVMRLLTVFSAFFLPLTFVAGIYGMNFHYMPELSSHWGYPAVLGSMGAITVVIYIWFKRKGLI